MNFLQILFLIIGIILILKGIFNLFSPATIWYLLGGILLIWIGLKLVGGSQDSVTYYEPYSWNYL